MKTPQLKLHTRGVYFTRYRAEGQTLSKYFTKDRHESQKLFNEWLRDTWTALATDRLIGRASQGHGLKAGDRPSCVRLAEFWLSHIQLEHGLARMRQYRSYLAPFLYIHGAVPAHHLTQDNLIALKHDLAELRTRGAGPGGAGRRYSARSVIAYTKAPKSMLVWAARRHIIPPIDLSEVRFKKLPKPIPRRITPDAVRDFIEASRDTDERLPNYLSLMYLTCARAGEVYRLISTTTTGGGGGRIVYSGRLGTVYELHGKTTGATGHLRYIPVTPEAMKILTHARPPLAEPFESLEWFLKRAQSVKHGGHSGAKALRAWGASELRHRGTPREDIRHVLGHATDSPLDHYVEEDLEFLLKTVRPLTLRPSSGRRRGA